MVEKIIWLPRGILNLSTNSFVDKGYFHSDELPGQMTIFVQMNCLDKWPFAGGLYQNPFPLHIFLGLLQREPKKVSGRDFKRK